MKLGKPLVALMLLALAVTAEARAGSGASSRTILTTPGPLSAEGEGRRLFLKLNCYGCHGMRAGGAMGPNIQHKGTGSVTNALAYGSPTGMPSFIGYYTYTDMRNIAAYLASIGTPIEPKWVEWWVPRPVR